MVDPFLSAMDSPELAGQSRPHRPEDAPRGQHLRLQGHRRRGRGFERSALSSAAQPYQELIDRILYALAGLSESDRRGLEERLAKML